ncbi:FUSC family protein [Microbacterium sp. NPDC016588]
MASLSLPRRTMAYAAVLVTAAAVVLGASRVLIGAEAAHAGYLAVMFLLSPARALDARVRYAAAGWAVVVAMAGYAIGSLGIVPLLIGLVVVCLVQSLFRAGEVASMTRSPVNFVAFAAVAQTGAPWWHVLLGSLVGAGFMLALARVLPDKERSPLPPVPPLRRLRYGILVAVGSIVIVLGARWLDFPYVGWTLLSFCMILAVGFDDRRSRARDRVLGTIAGAVAATLLSLAPAPVPLICAIVSTLLCVAYLRAGNYMMFVAFLTPAILLSSSSDAGAFSLGIGRVEAVIASAIVALACTAAAAGMDAIAHRRDSSPG